PTGSGPDRCRPAHAAIGLEPAAGVDPTRQLPAGITVSAPDLIVVGGTRFGAAGPEPGGLAVTGGLISAVARDDELRKLAGPGTEIVDLTGGFIMPGFQDAHVHPGQGGWERAACDLTGSGDRAGYAARI